MSGQAAFGVSHCLPQAAFHRRMWELAGIFSGDHFTPICSKRDIAIVRVSRILGTTFRHVI
jgi:hypothetical protein